VVTPRSQLPRKLAPLVPRHGIYAAGGGLTSSAWRVVIDNDANTIFTGRSKQMNASSLGTMEREDKQPLTPRNKGLLSKLADDACREPPPATAPQPTADYDELLIIADGDDTCLIEGYGPIHRPAAAHLIEMLRAAGGL
jgi:hypothetical protein